LFQLASLAIFARGYTKGASADNKVSPPQPTQKQKSKSQG